MTENNALDLQAYHDTAFATGDVLLFSGQSPFSHLIRTMTKSQWSHCGMVVCDETGKGSSKIWDVSKKIYGGAVGLYDLHERLNAYEGTIAHRPLIYNGTKRGLRTDDRARFEVIHDELLGRPYEKNNLELFKAAFDPKIINFELAVNDPDISSLFCAELLAETYQRLGILPQTVSANEYVPSDFAQAHHLPLEKGYAFTDEVLLKYQDDAKENSDT